ncbi:MAG: MerR family transcriptional regulator [Thermodesulfobacteriota bacterium]
MRPIDYRIGMAARIVGVNETTLRVLEKRGVISARRDWAGYRIYNEKELKEIEQKLFGDGMGRGRFRPSFPPSQVYGQK